MVNCSFYFNGTMQGIDFAIDYDTDVVNDNDVDKINDILWEDYKIKTVCKD